MVMNKREMYGHYNYVDEHSNVFIRFSKRLWYCYGHNPHYVYAYQLLTNQMFFVFMLTMNESMTKNCGPSDEQWRL